MLFTPVINNKSRSKKKTAQSLLSAEKHGISGAALTDSGSGPRVSASGAPPAEAPSPTPAPLPASTRDVDGGGHSRPRYVSHSGGVLVSSEQHSFLAPAQPSPSPVLTARSAALASLERCSRRLREGSQETRAL